MFKRQSDEVIVSWISSANLNELGRYLVSGVIHGKPGIPVAELGRIEKIVAKNFSVKSQYSLAKKLLKRPEYTARNIGTHLISAGWPEQKDVERYLLQAANDEDWIVREYAAGNFAKLLQTDFDHFSKLFLNWVDGESANVKRAIALAVKYDSKSGNSKKWEAYFKLIDPLMSESTEYIRKNLGPFTIGDGLLSRFPAQILRACKRWTKSKDENVRWNTAMIFTAAASRDFAKEGMLILNLLANDPSPFVSGAVKKAQKHLQKCFDISLK